MRDEAKISLSAFELELVTNPHWILTKNGIIQNVYKLLGEVSVRYQSNRLLKQLPAPITTLSPKISKGENYKGLPYVMLDYPRCFGKDDVFAIRSFFWWGHYFSITLHLKGTYFHQFSSSITKAIETNQLSEWYINNSNEEWDHDVETSMQVITPHHAAINTSIIKVSSMLSLDQWDEAADFYNEQFSLLMRVLGV